MSNFYLYTGGNRSTIMNRVIEALIKFPERKKFSKFNLTSYIHDKDFFVINSRLFIRNNRISAPVETMTHISHASEFYVFRYDTNELMYYNNHNSEQKRAYSYKIPNSTHNNNNIFYSTDLSFLCDQNINSKSLLAEEIISFTELNRNLIILLTNNRLLIYTPKAKQTNSFMLQKYLGDFT